MMRFNFKEASLLDASGELSPAARQALAAYLSENPAARLEYEDIRQQFQLLQSLPLPELARTQQTSMPARLKEKLAAAMREQARANQAATRRRLIRCAAAGITSAAAAVILVASLGAGGNVNWKYRDREQTARINSALERLAPGSESLASSYDLAVTDVEASIRQLQTESPTLAQLHDRSMGNLFDALSSVSQDWDDFATSDPPAPVQVAFPATSSSTILVTVTSPIFHFSIGRP